MIVDEIKQVIKEFPWHSYGLDLIDQAKSDNWADALAQRICGASGYVLLSHDVYREMSRTVYEVARQACTHPEYKDGRCAVMSCHNYVNKHTDPAQVRMEADCGG